MPVKRSDLMAHLRRTRFAAGDSEGARRDAQAVADMLKERHGAEVWGIGSLFETLAQAQELTSFDLDLIPWEDANDLVRDIVREAGVRL